MEMAGLLLPGGAGGLKFHEHFLAPWVIIMENKKSGKFYFGNNVMEMESFQVCGSIGTKKSEVRFQDRKYPEVLQSRSGLRSGLGLVFR